jgi:hypothetical protein
MLLLLSQKHFFDHQYPAPLVRKQRLAAIDEGSPDAVESSLVRLLDFVTVRPDALVQLLDRLQY